MYLYHGISGKFKNGLAGPKVAASDRHHALAQRPQPPAPPGSVLLTFAWCGAPLHANCPSEARCQGGLYVHANCPPRRPVCADPGFGV